MLEGFTPAPFAPAQEYSILCRNGHRFRGDRTEGYQAFRCTSCSEILFVLPNSPLPNPPAPVGKPKSKQRPSEIVPEAETTYQYWQNPVGGKAEDLPVTDGEIDWVDDSAGSHQSKGSEPIPVTPVETDPPRKARTKRPVGKAVASPEPILVVEPRESWRDWTIRKRNPLIFTGVLLLVALTVMTRLKSARLAELPRIIEIGRIEGLTALDEGEFDKAKSILSRAAAAVDQLSDQSESAAKIKQGAREAALFTDLNLESLERMIDLARASEPTEWARIFKTLHKHRSILIDAKIESVPEPGSSDSPTLDYTILCGNGPKPAAKGRLDLTGFDLLAGTSKKKGDGVLFGARLADITLDPRSGFWLVRLVPDSGEFLRHPKALESIGFITESSEDVEKRP